MTQDVRPSAPPLAIRVGLRLAVVLAACGCGGRGASAHRALPQIEYQGGKVVSSAQIVSVTFAGDPMTSDLQAFGQTVTSSSWWNAVRTEYCAADAGNCVGDGPAGTPVALTTSAAPSYTDSDVGAPSSLQAWLSSAFASGVLPQPTAALAAIYVLYVPGTTSVNLDGTPSCVDNGFDGYHNWMSVGPLTVPYAVVVECAPIPSSFPGVPAITLLQNTTITASHEILEVATDPLPPTGFTLDETDQNNWAWIDVAGEEAADLCVDVLDLNQDETSDGRFTAQRIWSNVQAASGSDPCKPLLPGKPYFNAAPRDAFFVVDVGSTVTFEVDAFASGLSGDWTVLAQDWSDTTTSTQYLELSIAGGTVVNSVPQIQAHDGATIEVTAKLLADPGALATEEADGAIVSVTGDPSNPTAGHYWPFAVMSPADAIEAGVDPSSRHDEARTRRRHHLRRVRRAPLSLRPTGGW